MTAPVFVAEERMADALVGQVKPGEPVGEKQGGGVWRNILGTAGLWFSGLFFMFNPWAIGRRWVKAPLGRSIAVALLNSVFGVVWLLVVVVCAERCLEPQ